MQAVSIYQRSYKKLWVVAWYEQGRKKTRSFKSRQLAEAFELERLELAGQSSGPLTLGELVLEFFQAHPDYHPKTKEIVRSFLGGRDKDGRHIEGPGEFLREKYADALNRQDLELVRKTLRNKGTGNKTINKYQAYIRAILAWGVDAGLINSNPWRDYKLLPAKRKIITTTIGDVRSIYECAPEWLQWAIMTMYALTIRPGHVELFGLMWSAFDWRRGVVMVRQGKSGRIKAVYPPVAYLEIAHLRYLEDTRAGIPWVCHRAGRRVLDYRTAWDKAVKVAGLPHIPMYNIRHVAVSEMLAQGADLAAVAAQAGHSTPATTSSFYAHVISGGQQRAAALLPSLNESKKGT